ncbi:hypothetical protein Nepgr_032254 [Nepenthes gracilis]|uniref:Uncharacterized protein n=1 Tax=Nepenthes gracilis TaxID=150966 RepID=A0AAD3TJY9_NEPGR|nr:hypothetical protein Nepgr_032254 [Nepenthes gracilis]
MPEERKFLAWWKASCAVWCLLKAEHHAGCWGDDATAQCYFGCLVELLLPLLICSYGVSIVWHLAGNNDFGDAFRFVLVRADVILAVCSPAWFCPLFGLICWVIAPLLLELCDCFV